MPAALPLKVAKNYSALGVGPHGITNRWVYTVPAGRFAILEGMGAALSRSTAPGALGHAQAGAQVGPATGGLARLSVIMLDSAAVGANGQAAWGASAKLIAGDQAIGYTLDVSVGGTINYDVSLLATEYDV